MMHCPQPHNHKRLRILYLITHGMTGGAQTHVLHLASHLCCRFDIHVAMGMKGSLWNDLAGAGIQVHCVPSLVRDVSPLTDMRALVEIIRLLKKIKPDLITIHSSKAGVLGRLASRICGVPAVFTAHGWSFSDGIPENQKRIYLTAERVAARWAEKIICVSEYDFRLARSLYGHGGDKLVTIQNGIPRGIDQHWARPGNRDPVRLIMVARFSDPKDHHLLLRAASQIHADVVFQLDLAGDGPLLSDCMELARQLKVDDKVNFLGARSDVPELLAKAHIFVLVSKREGLPLCILEAMRAGLPVIASDVGGTGELVDDGETGFLVSRGDVETLKNSLIRLINNSGLREQMGKKGREKFMRRFTLERMIDKTVEVYYEAMSEQR